jgi:Cu/Ag efflux protein CusF
MNTMKSRAVFLVSMIFFLCLALVPGGSPAAGHGGHGGHDTGASRVPDAGQPDAGRIHTTRGVIDIVDRNGEKLTITHEAIPALNWPAMTMRFGLENPALLEDARPGDKVRFDFRERGGEYRIVDLENIQ